MLLALSLLHSQIKLSLQCILSLKASYSYSKMGNNSKNVV